MDKRKNGVKTEYLVELYTKRGLTLRQIGMQVGMSHAGVRVRLKKAGVEDSRIEVNCGYCGVRFRQVRSRWRKRLKESYCSAEHYYAARENPDFMEWRQGSRLARAVVAQHFELEKEHRVHHVDSDQRNNDLVNLWVFASQSDHLKWHHYGNVEPIWKGSEVVR
jgi:hypothetical protein